MLASDSVNAVGNTSGAIDFNYCVSAGVYLDAFNCCVSDGVCFGVTSPTTYRNCCVTGNCCVADGNCCVSDMLIFVCDLSTSSLEDVSNRMRA